MSRLSITALRPHADPSPAKGAGESSRKVGDAMLAPKEPRRLGAGWFAARLGLDMKLDVEGMARQEEARLAQRLFLKTDANARRAVLFAEVERENGCAGICVRVARKVAALTSRRICVVDANLRSPSVHRSFGVDNRLGLAAAISNSVSAPMLVRRLSPDNLWLLPSGTSNAAPDLLLTTDRVRPHIQDLGGRFDHLLINSPPVNACEESLALGRVTDGLVLIVEANSTTRRAVRRAISRLEAFEIPLLGIVLNGRTFPIPEPLYRLL